MLENYQSILTTEEVADILRLNERTVLKLVKEGTIPALKIANQYRFPKDSIIQWIESHLSQYQSFETDTEKSVMNISELLKPEHIILNCSNNDKKQVIKSMIEKGADSGVVRNKTGLMDQVLQREQIQTTALGSSTAFPHPRSTPGDLVNSEFLCAAVTKKGIDMKAEDGEPVRLFFLFAVPNATRHIRILARLVQMIRTPELTEQLIHTGSENEFIRLIKKTEKTIDRK